MHYVKIWDHLNKDQAKYKNVECHLFPKYPDNKKKYGQNSVLQLD